MRPECIILSLVIYVTSADLLDFIKPPVLLKSVPVKVLKTEEEVLKASSAVVFVTNASSDPQADALAELTSGRAKPTSIFLAKPGVLKDLAEGSIAVFRAGRKWLYHGLNDSFTLLKFISSLEGTAIKTITNKLDKVAFDHTKRAKLVGYFVPGSQYLTVFEEAATLFGSQVSFFVVTDPTVAKHLKFNSTGQIQFVREFDKTPMFCPVNPASLVEIQQLIVRNRDSFVKVTPMNIKDPSFTGSLSILLITDSNPLSFHLLKLVTRYNRANTQIRPRVLWIDINDFPTIDLTSQPIHGLVNLPGFGCWYPSTGSVEWMDLTILNAAPGDRVEEDANLLLMKNFITSRCSAVSSSTSSSSTVQPKAPKSEL